MRCKMLGSALGLYSARCRQTPKCDNQKRLWTSPDVPWRANSPSVDSHCVKGEECGNNVTNASQRFSRESGQKSSQGRK